MADTSPSKDPNTETLEHENTETLDHTIPDAFEFEEASGGVEAYRLKENGLQVLLLEEAAVPVVYGDLPRRKP